MNINTTTRSIAIAAALLVAGLAATPASAGPVTGTNSIAQGIPDNNPTGVSSVINFGASGLINFNSLSVVVAMDHTWLGDLVVTLSNGSNTVMLMDRPGSPIPSALGDSSNLSATRPLTFSATASILNPAEAMGLLCTGTQTVGVNLLCSNTIFLPQQSLSVFNGTNIQGNWTLNVSDRASSDVGRLASWTLNADVTSQVPEPGSLALVGLALAGMGVVSARRKAPIA